LGPNVVKQGWDGIAVNSFPNWSSTTYSVDFIPEESRSHAYDVRPDGSDVQLD